VYFQARFIAIPSLMILALPGAWFWLQRRERLSRDARGGRVIARSNDRARLAAELDRATAAGDGRDFFCAARAALQSVLSERWQVPPNAVTLPEIEARLGPDSDVRKVFALADEVMYCGRNFARQDLEAWLRIVRYQMQQGAVHERARAAQT
jgi:hypothetical protein